MKVKKNLSLDENLIKNAETRAKQLGFNFSAYVTYLINNDINNLNIIKSEPVKVKDKKVVSAINDILG